MKIFYLRDKKKHPVACVAWETKKETILFAVSTWNADEDGFNLEHGRAMAVGRFYLSPHTIGTSIASIAGVPTIVGIIANEKEFPTRTRRAAVLWCKKLPKNREIVAA